MDEHVLSEEQLQRLIAVGRKLVAELDLERLLRYLLESAREITGARYAAIGVLDRDRETLARFVTSGVDEPERDTIGDLPRGRGVLGVLIRDPRPLRLSEVGSHPQSYGFPPGHPPMGAFLGVPVAVRGEAWGNIYLTEKAGGDEFTAADEESLIVLADWAAVAIDNARWAERVETRRNELEHAVVRLEATTEIARAVGGETDLERVLELIAKRGRALVSARTVLIMLAEGRELLVVAAAGAMSSDAPGRRLPIAESSSGQVFRSRRAVRIADAAHELLIAPAAFGVEARSALLVPLVFRGEPLGVLAAFDRLGEGPEFTADDEHLMRSFAASAATAVHTARSVTDDRLREALAAQEQERRRWARELHDETLQGLAALQITLTAARGRTSDPELSSVLAGALAHTREEIVKLRALITELRPAALDELGLAVAIESLADRTRALHHLDITVTIDLAGLAIPADLEATVYRVAQEALTNAAKHASPSRVLIAVSVVDGHIRLLGEDDGDGFAVGPATQGFGLQGMHERVSLLHGKLDVSSAGGQGTRVEALLPVPIELERPGGSRLGSDAQEASSSSPSSYS